MKCKLRIAMLWCLRACFFLTKNNQISSDDIFIISKENEISEFIDRSTVIVETQQHIFSVNKPYLFLSWIYIFSKQHCKQSSSKKHKTKNKTLLVSSTKHKSRIFFKKKTQAEFQQW